MLLCIMVKYITFKELKRKFNLNTKSNSDTEILIEMFSLLNVKCFDYLNGIFALIIFDKVSNKIYCVRDRLGLNHYIITMTVIIYIFVQKLKVLKKLLTI